MGEQKRLMNEMRVVAERAKADRDTSANSRHDWVKVKYVNPGDDDLARKFYYLNTKTRRTTWTRPEVSGEVPIYGKRTHADDDDGNENNANRDDDDDDDDDVSNWYKVRTDDGECTT